MMGLPEGWVTQVEGLSRATELRLLGNSVVPQQAAQALQALLPRGSDLAPDCQKIAWAQHLGTSP
jgi:DNA (cytosine-5)-methyltransferase 1